MRFDSWLKIDTITGGITEEENVMEEKEFDKVKYKNDFNKQKYDRINLMVPKGKKDELKQLAKEAGISVNEYINRKLFGSND